MVAFSLWPRFLPALIESKWLILGLLILVLPLREFEYYSGALIALGTSILAAKQCKSRSFSYVSIAVVWIAYGQYLSVHNSRGIGISVMILLAISIWVGSLDFNLIARLMLPVCWLSVPVLVFQLIGYSFNVSVLGHFFIDKTLGGLSIAQTSSLVGIMVVSSAYLIYSALRRYRVNLLELSVKTIPFLCSLGMALFTGQRSSYLIPLFSVAIAIFLVVLNSANNRIKIRVLGFLALSAIAYVTVSFSLPTIGSIKFGITDSEVVRLDAIHCVVVSSLGSIKAFVFGHGFRSFSDHCYDLNGLLDYHSFFKYIGHAHNLVAQVAFSLGVPLSCFLSLFLFKGFTGLYKSLKSSDPALDSLNIYLLMLFAFCFLNSMVEVSFLKVPALAMVFGLVFGSALGVEGMGRKSSDDSNVYI